MIAFIKKHILFLIKKTANLAKLTHAQYSSFDDSEGFLILPHGVNVEGSSISVMIFIKIYTIDRVL